MPWCARFKEYRYGTKLFRLVEWKKWNQKWLWESDGYTYDEALEICEGMKGGSFTLASVASKDEFEFLRSKTYRYHYWIGLNQKHVFGHFVWQDGTEMHYGDDIGKEPWSKDAPRHEDIAVKSTVKLDINFIF